MPIRLISYNIHSGIGTDGRKDYARINEFLQQMEADIVLLQEMNAGFHHSEVEDVRKICGSRFKHFLAGKTIQRSNGWYGNAILSRYAIADQNIVDISLPGRQPRNIMEVFFETPFGRLHVLNTHKGLRSSERKSQLKRLHELLVKQSKVPMVVAGDINEWHTSSRALQDLNTTLSAVHVGATFPTRFPVFHLDRVWCRPKDIVISAQAIKTPNTKVMSDHYPVLITVDFAKG